MSESTTTPTTPEPTVFSTDYVRELRAENKGYRLKAQEFEAALKQAQEAVKIAATEYEAKTAEVQSAATQRLIRAELKAFAVKAGMVDLDGLKLLDLTKVKLDDDGEVVGADALIKAAKESKPWLFGQTTSTSSTETPPKPAPTVKKTAKEMSDVELRAFELEHNIRVRQ